jgi:hypothetical protein
LGPSPAPFLAPSCPQSSCNSKKPSQCTCLQHAMHIICNNISAAVAACVCSTVITRSPCKHRQTYNSRLISLRSHPWLSWVDQFAQRCLVMKMKLRKNTASWLVGTTEAVIDVQELRLTCRRGYDLLTSHALATPACQPLLQCQQSTPSR